MQVKTQLSHSSSWEWWKDYDADNCIGAGFFIFAGSLEKEYWQSPLSAVNSSTVNKSYSSTHQQSTNHINSFLSSQESKYKMYLFKFQKVFVQIAKCVCSNFKKYLSKLQNVFVQISKCICQIAKCICSNFKKYLSELQNVFVQIS